MKELQMNWNDVCAIISSFGRRRKSKKNWPRLCVIFPYLFHCITTV